MENGMLRRELVAMFMKSPFYFDMMLRDRLGLVQKYENRFSTQERSKSNHSFVGIAHQSKSDKSTVNNVKKFVVGYFPSKSSPRTN
jgi:hypothetical protein